MTGAELLEKVLARIDTVEKPSGVSFLDSLNAAVEVIFSKLIERKSHLVKADLDLVTDVDPFSLPDDFRGFAEQPYLILDRAVPLLPLPEGGARDFYGKTGVPEYYRITGLTIQLFPYSSDGQLRSQYYSCPVEVAMTDDLPWHGLNRIIEDATCASFEFGGISGLLANDKFMFTLQQSLDRLHIKPLRRDRVYEI
jgi:hypothetical protein